MSVEDEARRAIKGFPKHVLWDLAKRNLIATAGDQVGAQLMVDKFIAEFEAKGYDK